ncbi:MAG: hypothetical protein KBF48_12955 [Xanthomonadales bacterium]|nr:hypothetical protein [Xanthomonadales bacterium]
MARKPFLPPAVQALKDSIDNGTLDSPPADAAPENTEPTDDQFTVDADPAFTPEAADPSATPSDNGLQARFDALSAEHDRLKHKHDVLQGKYDAELPRLRQEKRELELDLDDLTRQLATRQQPAPVASSEPDTNADDEATLGTDAIAAIDRRVEKIVERRLEPVARATQQTAAEKFQAKVEETVPDWRTVQESPEFQAHMREPHPETGEPRGELLMDALRKGDSTRVARIYAKAKEVLGIKAPTANTAPGAAGVVVKQLADRVAPSGASAASTPVTTTSRIYKQSDVKTFFDQWAIKKTKAMPVKERGEWEAKERDITAAQQQGRIRQG